MIVRSIFVLLALTGAVAKPAFTQSRCDSLKVRLKSVRENPALLPLGFQRSLLCECEALIPCYYAEGNFRAVDSLARLYSALSGGGTESARLRMLLAIRGNRLSEEQYDSTVIDALTGYREAVRHHERYYWRGCSESADNAFRAFVDSLVETLVSETDTTTLDYAFVRFYRGDFDYFFDRIKSPEFSQTAIRWFYDAAVARTVRAHRNSGDLFSLWGGIWMPFGDTRVLKNQPEYGISIGHRTTRFRYDIVFAYRGGHSTGPYYLGDAPGSDSRKTSLSDISFGFDFGRRLKQTSRLDLDGVIGASWESLGQAATISNDTNPATGFSLSVGPRCRWYLNKYTTKYLSLQARCALVGYNTHGGSHLNGGTFTLTLAYGFVSNSRYTDRLKLLNY